MPPQISEQLRRRLPLLLAVLLGGLAVLLVNSHIQREVHKLRLREQQLLRDYKDPIKLIVAAKDLPPGTLLDAGHLAQASVPEKFMQPYAARSPRDVLGMVTAAPMAQGEQILLNKLRRADEAVGSATLAGMTPQGTRAVTIGVDAITGVGGFVRPGDAVDVLWTVKLPGQAGEVVTLTLFQDIAVFAVGREIIGRPVATDATGAAPPAGPQYTVTLALAPQEISFLLFAREQGRIQLSLRPKQEAGAQIALSPATSATFNQFMQQQLGIQSTEPTQARPPRQVEVYKGLERDVILLSEDAAAGR